MSSLSKRYRPVNSIVFVCDPDGGETAIPYNGEWIIATSSSISIRCRSEQESATRFILGPAEEVGPDFAAAFDSLLETPKHEVAIMAADGEVILKSAVSAPSVRIRIWVNRPTHPDRVIVGVGS